MKKLMKFFMPVVALVAFSCTTDTTEDLGVELGGGQNATVFSVSLEESRTHIADAVGDFYPMYWSAGDKISVNGVASEKLAEGGSASASFTITGAITAPYCVAYPVALNGQVVFAPEQTHTSNTTFGNGVTTMYGYSESSMSLELKHLTGILKIGITGEATLTYAQVSTIDRTPIAGGFLLDFESGEVTPTESATEVIGYSFGEGLTLSNDAQYIHIAVPAGVYDELYVTLYDNAGGVMYATVRAGGDSKPLAAGSMRTFKNSITYAANTEVFVVKDVESLKTFAAQAATLEKNVVFVADVDLSGETDVWTPIEGYAGTINGNGYAIKGLTAPLFGTTNAAIKGLHLTGVNIQETTTPNVGAFARAMVATDTTAPTLEHCSASGSISVNCPDYALPEGADDTRSFAIGGLVGRIEGVSIKNCSNAINVDVDQVVNTTDKTIIYVSVAGVVGLIEEFKSDETFILANLSDCENEGSINAHAPKGAAAADDNYRNNVVGYTAGVAARFTSGNKKCSVSNIINRGDVTMSGWYGQGIEAEDDKVSYADIDPCLGGAIAYIESVEASHIYNYGKVSVENGSYTRFHYVGGVVGMSGADNVLSNLHNHGEVDVHGGSAALHCAGVVAHTIVGGSLTESSNNAAVTASLVSPGGEKHRYRRVAGVVAFADGSVKNCHNNTGGTVTCGGNMNNIRYWTDVCFAGVVAYKESDAVEDCTNNAAVNVNFTSKGGADINHNRVTIGGVVGLSAQPCNNITNNGAITVGGTYMRLLVGGAIGDMNNVDPTTLGGYHNNAPITIADGTTLNYITHIGGSVGFTKGTVNNLTNSANGTINIGKITVTARQSVTSGDKTTNYNNYTDIGGCVGHCWEDTGVVNGATNSGAITIADEATFGRWTLVGGVVGRSNGTLSNLTNNQSGAIQVNNATFSYITMFAGCVGFSQAGANGSITTAENNAPITIADSATFGHTIYVAGCVGLPNNAVSGIENKATGTITLGAFSATVDTEHYIGGCVARAQTANGAITTATNRGAINVASNFTGSDNIYIGGVVGVAEEAPAKTVTNHGAINITSSFTGISYIGGIVGESQEDAAVETADNYGAINVSSTVAGGKRYIAGISPRLIGGGTGLTNHGTGDITVALKDGANTYVSGVAGYVNVNCTDLLNEGDITINGSIKALSLISGVFSNAAYENLTFTRCSNKGNITINGAITASEPRIAGLQGDTNFIQTWDSCYNSGKITISNSANITVKANIGGLCGYTRETNKVQKFKNCYNSGAIEVQAGARFGGYAYIGGIIGQATHNAPVVDGYLYNTGTISVLNTANAADNLLVGGIVGNTAVTISDAQCVCNINVTGMTESSSSPLRGVGLITGTHRGDTALVNSCKLSGNIAYETIDGAPQWKPVDRTGGEYSEADDTYTGIFWYKKIYGGEWADASSQNADDCSFTGFIDVEE